MTGKRFMAALAAAALPFFMTSWIELVSVDQPTAVDPGTTFTATVDAIGHVWDGPMPLDSASADMPPRDLVEVPMRMGVLVPDSWAVADVAWTVKGATGGSLSPAPDETLAYEGFYAPPTGYRWWAFSGDSVSVDEGSSFQYTADISAGETTGLFKVVYMTWTQPPVMYETPPSPAAPDQYPWPSPGPSILETSIAVGDVGPAPRVTGWDPPDGAADVPLDSDIRVTFSRDMDVRSLREGGIQVFAGPVYYATDGPAWEGSSSLAPDFMPPPWDPWPVPVQVFYNAAERTAVVDPLDPLGPHDVYTVMVTYEAKAADGVPVDMIQTASFLTVRGPEPPFFSDVPPDHRFRTAIETLYDAGIISGYPDGTFQPDNPVTRADVAKWLVLLLGIHTPEPDPLPPFSDVPSAPGDAMTDYISEAAAAGITAGFDDGTFRPLDTVTRIQLTRMIVRAAQPWMTPPHPWFTAGFLDVDPADRGYVDWAYYNDLVDGKGPGRFDPWSTATRGHTARILYGVWNLVQPRPIPVPEPGDGSSGVNGLVTLGPLHPVEQPGQPNARPYEATIVVKDEGGTKEVARVRSGPDGRFTVALPPGTYRLDPLPGGDLLPFAKPVEVVVEEGGYTEVLVAYDTGIR